MATRNKMEPTFKDIAKAVQIAIVTTTKAHNHMAVLNETSTALVWVQQTKRTLPMGTATTIMMGWAIPTILNQNLEEIGEKVFTKHGAQRDVSFLGGFAGL